MIIAYEWTDQIKADVVRQYMGGKSAAQIAKYLTPDSNGRRPSRSSVIGVLHRSGVDRTEQRASYPAGANRTALYTPPAQQRQTEAQAKKAEQQVLRETLTEMYLGRKPMAEIAAPVGMTEEVCRARITRLGLRGREPVRPAASEPAKPKTLKAKPALIFAGNNTILTSSLPDSPLVRPPRAGAFKPLPDTVPQPLFLRPSKSCCWPIVGPDDTDDIARFSCCAPSGDDKYCPSHMSLSRNATQAKTPSQRHTDFVSRHDRQFA